MNGTKIYHSKFGTLETIKLRHSLLPKYITVALIQATTIVHEYFHSRPISLYILITMTLVIC